MPDLLTVGALFGSQNLSDGQSYDTTVASVYLGGTVNVTNGSILNLDPVAAVGVATTFNVSDGGTVNYDPTLGVTAANTFNIGSGGTLSLGEDVTASALDNINFTSPTEGPGGTLIIPESVLSANVISSIDGFGVSDSLQIANPDGTIASGDYNTDTGELVFYDAEGQQVSTLQLGLDGDVNAENFAINVNGDGSLSVVACYLRGTRIATDHGEVAIEDIRIGDKVATVAGTFRTVKWIGRRGYSSTYAAKTPEVQPILFTRGSIAENVPVRDLYVSPQHAMFIDGVLVDAELLVNGKSIRRIETDEAVEYFNLEFETHDVILAEGAPSESFLNRDCRDMFQNAAEYEVLYPGETPCEPVFYARRVADGHALAAIRERLNARAGLAGAEPAAPGVLEGAVDRADWSRVAGWAHDRANPGRPVELEVLVDSRVVARVMANRYRADLEKAGFGDGRCGFDIELPEALSPRSHHSIEVRRAADAQPLRGAPLLLEAVPELASTGSLLKAVCSDIGGADPTQLDRMLRLVMDGLDKVVQAKTRDEGQGHARQTRFHARGEAVHLPATDKVA
jgi:hypothetical protein